jgi:predicted alpha/beta hydrolase family esterase
MQTDWTRPRRTAWVATLLAAVERDPESIVVAHSLGCALVANAVKARPQLPVRAALLVSPSDVDNADHIEDPVRDFAPMPLCRFHFRTIVVASRNDPYVKFGRAQFFATEWGAELIDVGARGISMPTPGSATGGKGRRSSRNSPDRHGYEARAAC